jgi:hypothetical protein
MATAIEDLKTQIIEKTKNIMSKSEQGVQNISNTNEIDKMFKFLQISAVPENIQNKLKEVKKILIKDTDITTTVPGVPGVATGSNAAVALVPGTNATGTTTVPALVPGPAVPALVPGPAVPGLVVAGPAVPVA